MLFYDRVNELSELMTLSAIARKKTVLSVITGVRRVGKTELIKEFFKKEDGLYFFVDRSKNSAQLLSDFSLYLKKSLELPERIETKNWEEFFQDLFDYAKKKKLVVAFDEFQRFSFIEPQIPFILQKAFDLNKNESKLLILISGSSFGLLKNMFIEQGAPLFQRNTNMLTLKEFEFETVCKILEDLGINDFSHKIEFYAFFGGIPKYYELIEDYEIKTPDEAIKKLLYRDLAPLRDEVKNILLEEFGKETPSYYSILAAAALGKTKPNEIADASSLKETSITPYLYDLTELLGALKKELPVTEDVKSKKTRYYLKNQFFKLWFKFIYRKSSEVELGKFTELYNEFLVEKNSFVGIAFEEVCKQFLAKTTPFTKIGKWWGKNNNTTAEIDILALDEKNNAAVFAECKWRSKPPTTQDLINLKNKAQCVEWRKSERTEKLIFFTKTIPDNKIQEYAKQNNMRIIDLKELKEKMN